MVTDTPVDVDGGVLVTYRTDPGWVAALPSASALIIERGSPLTHVAIVARELGIPTVVQVKGAVAETETGMRLRVDGGTGTITFLDDAPAESGTLAESGTTVETGTPAESGAQAEAATSAKPDSPAGPGSGAATRTAKGPSYGLAEATLAVTVRTSGAPAPTVRVDTRSLRFGRPVAIDGEGEFASPAHTPSDDGDGEGGGDGEGDGDGWLIGCGGPGDGVGSHGGRRRGTAPAGRSPR
ncbi:PEP-utilizing enzyme [Streptomyces malaysiensis]|uniref:PEP-utilizing enzyme n=1 Tax=Streptomyces malaysiensis TaxID=92644 RepID=UPI002B316809|nr:PEP-utilizing enzyme [Streptomyces malaysiensis]